MTIRTCLYICILLLLFSCKASIDPPVLSTGDADFKTLAAVGGDFLSGYENGALSREGQINSVPALLADRFKQVYLQMGQPDFVTDFKQPLMPYGQGFGLNSKKWESEFISPLTLGYKVDCEGVESLSPLKNLLNISAQSAAMQFLIDSGYQNLAVPFAKINDLTDPSFGLSYSQGNENPYYGKFASEPGKSTVLGDAVSLNPSFLVLWLGMEDIYDYAASGGYNKTIPAVSEFSAGLDAVLGPLTVNGAKGVISNIPDFEDFPFYTLVPYNAAEMSLNQADSLNEQYEIAGWTHIHFKEGNNAFIIEDTTDTSLTSGTGYRHIGSSEHILLNVPLDSMKCYLYGLLFNTIHNRYILDRYEIQAINNAISSYNQIIASMAGKYNLALVDMNSYLKSLQSGIKWNGVQYNSEFVSGGFYSLDGYHPNQKGSALIANEFIKAINAKYGAAVPPANCSGCTGIQFP